MPLWINWILLFLTYDFFLSSFVTIMAANDSPPSLLRQRFSTGALRTRNWRWAYCCPFCPLAVTATAVCEQMRKTWYESQLTIARQFSTCCHGKQCKGYGCWCCETIHVATFRTCHKRHLHRFAFMRSSCARPWVPFVRNNKTALAGIQFSCDTRLCNV